MKDTNPENSQEKECQCKGSRIIRAVIDGQFCIRSCPDCVPKSPKPSQLGVKVKNWYYQEPTNEQRETLPYWTGIIMELENGLIFRQCSTDSLQPYSLIKPNEKV